MSSKVRKQVYLEPRQEVLLKLTSQQTGVSEAEIIRQAIDRHLGATTLPQTDFTAWEKEKAFIQQTKQRPTLPGGRDWSREDLYAR